MRTLENPKKYSDEMEKYKVVCKCGKRTLFPPLIKKEYKICGFCGRKVYRNKKDEFLDKMKGLMK